jgi:ketosteroid isomerase-like protein
MRGRRSDAMIAAVGEALDIATAWVEACDRGDAEAALALCDPEVELVEAETLPGAVTATGMEEVRRYLERFEAHWSEAHWEPIEFRDAGERVYLRARLRLTGRRSGVEVDREWIYVFTVSDGKLLRQEGFDREEDGLRAAGLS